MKLLLIFMVIFGCSYPVWAVTDTSNSSPQPAQQVVGGIDASITEVPWQVYVEINVAAGNFACGGTIISEHWVLTAAHCVANEQQQTVAAANVRVYAGADSRPFSNRIQRYNVSAVIIHPNYNALVNDIALLRLTSDIKPPAQPIKLIEPASQNDADLEFSYGHADNLFLSGWGRTSADGTASTQVLQKTLLTGVDDNYCADDWGWRSDFSQYYVCANAINAGSCSGDSGGALVWQDKNAVADTDYGYRLIGVVSFGNTRQCAYNPLPDVYTQVSLYLNWIVATTGDYQVPNPRFSTDVFAGDYGEQDNSSGGSLNYLLVLLLVMLLTRIHRQQKT